MDAAGAGYPVGGIKLRLWADSGFIGSFGFGPNFLALDAPGPVGVLSLSPAERDTLVYLARCERPPLPTHFRLDNALGIELPATGGYLADSAPVADSILIASIPIILARRPESAKAILVWPVPLQRCDDLVPIIRAAQRGHGAVYDAAKSGWQAKYSHHLKAAA